MKSLTPLKIVYGSIRVRGSSLRTLGSLEYVGGNLSLRYSNVTDLGNLEYVGGNLLVSKYNLENYDFSNVQIKGKIRKYSDVI